MPTFAAFFQRGVFWLLLGSVAPCLSQEILLERVSQEERESSEGAESDLQELFTHPIDLNHASLTELLRLPFFTPEQIEAFLADRKITIFYDNLELALSALQVTGDTLQLCRQIFTIKTPKLRSSPWQARVRSRVVAPATKDRNWRGPAYGVYNQARLQAGEFSMGMLTERDPGEPRLDDHRLLYLAWQRQNPRGKWRALLGNYQIEWAHGLALWSAYGSAISSNVHVAGRRWGRELRPYLAASETFAHFGAAILRAWSNLEFLAFASSKKRDVRLLDDHAPVSYRTTGYHRLPSEISQRGNLRESAWGSALKYRFQAGSEVGVLYYLSRYDRAWQIEEAGVDHFDFTGRENGVLSLMARGRWAGLWLSLETAHSRSGGNAGSLVMSGDEGALRWTVALYRFEVDFHSPQGRSLHGTDETPQAETGYSLGLSLKLRPGLTAESYYRRARSLWPTALLPLPPDRREFGFNSKWQMARRLSLYLRYRNSANERLNPVDEFGVLRHQLPEHIEKIRLELEHRLGTKTYLRPRLDWGRQQRSDFKIGLPASDSLPSIPGSQTYGLALAVNFSWQILRNLAISVQHAVFDSEIPLYYYERDLPGVFTVRAVRGQGLRRYIYVHLKVLPNLSVACKIATTEQESSAFQRQQNTSWALQLDWGR